MNWDDIRLIFYVALITIPCLIIYYFDVKKGMKK